LWFRECNLINFVSNIDINRRTKFKIREVKENIDSEFTAAFVCLTHYMLGWIDVLVYADQIEVYAEV